jgi:hypothetical protein
MDSASAPAVIVIRRPRHFFGGARSFIVWIDGQRVGKVRPQAVAEFPVQPGERTVVVSMEWMRSRPARVVAGPGSRTELAIGGRSGFILKTFVPIIIAGIAVLIILEVLRAAGGAVDTHWWARWLAVVGIYLALFGGYALIAPMLARDYWELWTLEPVGASSPRMPAESEPVNGLPPQ